MIVTGQKFVIHGFIEEDVISDVGLLNALQSQRERGAGMRINGAEDARLVHVILNYVISDVCRNLTENLRLAIDVQFQHEITGIAMDLVALDE